MTTPTQIPTPAQMREMALQILTQRYPKAAFAFAAGSLVRGCGEGTATSDLDLVVIFDSLPHAYRESFEYAGRPVEAFVNDPETVHHFMVEVDCKSGYPCMPHMLCTGLVIPDRTAMSDRLQAIARTLLEQGPPPLDDQQRLWMRYMITDALDDLRCARSPQERSATAAALYDSLGNAYLRLRGRWSGRGKWLPRLLHQYDPDFARRFTGAFNAIWQGGDCQPLMHIADEALAPSGGLFTFREGHYQAAQPEWRRPLPDLAADAHGSASEPLMARPYLDFARSHYNSKDPAHDFRHIERLVSRLSRFSQGMPTPPRPALLYFLAAFHGLAPKLRCDDAFRSVTEAFLTAQGWSREQMTEGFAALQRHLSDPQTVEEAIVHDANYIEMLGAFGVAKAFTTGGARGQSMGETADIYEHRYLDKVQFRTPAGRQAAQEGRAYAKAFLARLQAEL